MGLGAKEKDYWMDHETKDLVSSVKKKIYKFKEGKTRTKL